MIKMLNEHFSRSRVRSEGDGVAQMVKDTCRQDGGCELGLVARSPLPQPVLLPRCVQRSKRPVFAQREIIYTWMR